MAKTAEEKAASAKNARLKRFFRITLDQYKEVEEYEQATMPVLLGTTRRALDHNHTTGQLRGVLDFRINRALGMIETSFKEKTPEILRALAFYLDLLPVSVVLGPRYGIIGKAKKKKKMFFGSPSGPYEVKETKKPRAPKKRSHKVKPAMHDYIVAVQD
jgi:hypothetical protein